MWIALALAPAGRELMPVSDGQVVAGRRLAWQTVGLADIRLISPH